MSFRQFGGINYAARHNIVGSNYNTSNNLLVTQNVGQPNSFINFESDISGNINVYGDIDVSGNLDVGGNIDCSGNITAEYMFLSSGTEYNEQPNALMPKSYIDLVSTGLNPVGQVNVISTSATEITTTYPVPINTPFTGPFIIDDYTLQTNDNVLLNDQINKVDNGVYVYTDLGGGSYEFIRSGDILPTGYDAKGAFIGILNGLQYGRTGWVQTYSNNLDVAIVGTDDLIFKDFYNFNYRLGQGLFSTQINGITFINVDNDLDFLTSIDASSSNPNLDIGTINATTINMGQSGGSTTTNLTGTLDVTGTTSISSNATVGGTLQVTGATTLNNNLTLNGSSSYNLSVYNNSTSTYQGAFTYNSGLNEGTVLSADGTTTEIKMNNTLSTHFTISNSANKFQIVNSSSSPNPYTSGNNLLTILSTGNVGINNSAPASILDVNGTANISSNATVGGTLGVTGATSLSGNLAVNTNSFTVDSGTGNTSVAGTLGVTGATSLSSTLLVKGGYSVTLNTGDLLDVYYTGSNYLYFNNQGTIGVNNAWSINTTNGGQLIINYNNPSAGYSQLDRGQLYFSNSNDFGSISFNIPSSDSGYLQIGTGDNGTEPIIFTQNNTGTQYERMRVHSNGYIGISNNAPAYTLDVGGTANISSNATVGGTLSVTGGVQLVDSNSGGVQIGTSGAACPLNVFGNITASGYLVLNGGGTFIAYQPSSSNTACMAIGPTSTNCYIELGTNNGSSAFNTNSYSNLYITSAYAAGTYLSIVPSSYSSAAISISGTLYSSGTISTGQDISGSGTLFINNISNNTSGAALNITGAGGINLNNNTSITGNLSFSNGTTQNSAFTGGTPGTYTNANITIDGNGQITSISNGSTNGNTPVGGIIMWSGADNAWPSNWALCNGQTVNSITTPNLQARFIVGSGSGGGYTYTTGQSGGAATVTLSSSEIPAHTHPINDPGHVHFMQAGQDEKASEDTGETNYSEWTANYPYSTTVAYTNISVQNNQGGGGAHENRPPYYVLAFIMRVS
jgi:microcystin-dependent protein